MKIIELIFHKNYYYYLYIKKYKIKGNTSPLELLKNQIHLLLQIRKIIFLEFEIDTKMLLQKIFNMKK